METLTSPVTVLLGIGPQKAKVLERLEIRTLGDLLRSRGKSTAVGDEGGFAPDLASNEEAIQWILEAISLCGYQPGAGYGN